MSAVGLAGQIMCLILDTVARKQSKYIEFQN